MYYKPTVIEDSETHSSCSVVKEDSPSSLEIDCPTSVRDIRLGKNLIPTIFGKPEKNISKD